jgi:hypothetical protein
MKEQAQQNKIVATIITLFDRVLLGEHYYDYCPREGDWITLSDNDGSGDNLWRIELVVHFFNGGIALHVTPINRWEGLSVIEKSVKERESKNSFYLPK